jgi:hypothetical protein
MSQVLRKLTAAGCSGRSNVLIYEQDLEDEAGTEMGLGRIPDNPFEKQQRAGFTAQ